MHHPDFLVLLLENIHTMNNLTLPYPGHHCQIRTAAVKAYDHPFKGFGKTEQSTTQQDM